jgi:hypothetical protein
VSDNLYLISNAVNMDSDQQIVYLGGLLPISKSMSTKTRQLVSEPQIDDGGLVSLKIMIAASPPSHMSMDELLPGNICHNEIHYLYRSNNHILCNET